jgi:hypothetical protein
MDSPTKARILLKGTYIVNTRRGGRSRAILSTSAFC